MKKLVDVAITNHDETRVYTIGPLRFEEVMANEELKKAAGLIASQKKKDVVPGTGYDTDDSGNPVEQVVEATITDYQSMVVSIICGTVRKIDGEDVRLTSDDVNDMDLVEAMALFNAIQQIIKPQEGGRKAVTFQVIGDDDGGSREGVQELRDDAEPVRPDA